jgi:hypothetical protein
VLAAMLRQRAPDLGEDESSMGHGTWNMEQEAVYATEALYLALRKTQVPQSMVLVPTQHG